MKEWAWVLRACGKSKIKFVLYFVFLFFGNSHGNHTNRHCKSQTDCLLTEYCDLQYSGTCQCRDGYVSGKEGSPCVKGRHAGETCLLDAQCALLNPSLVCFEGRCMCQSGLQEQEDSTKLISVSEWQNYSVNCNSSVQNPQEIEPRNDGSYVIFFIFVVIPVLSSIGFVYSFCSRIGRQRYRAGLQLRSRPDPLNRLRRRRTLSFDSRLDIQPSTRSNDSILDIDTGLSFLGNRATDVHLPAPSGSPVNSSTSLSLSNPLNPSLFVTSSSRSINNRYLNDPPPSYCTLSPPSFQDATRQCISLPTLFPPDYEESCSVASSDISVATERPYPSSPRDFRGTNCSSRERSPFP